MKYEHWYNRLMENAVSRNWTRESAPVYVEKHHIKPRSLGGDDSLSNLVFLTAREHFIAHRLLCMFGDSNQKQKMVFAMQRFLFSMKDRTHINSRTYTVLRDQISAVRSQRMKGNDHRRGIPHSPETKNMMSRQRTGVPKKDITKKRMSESAKKSWESRDIVTCCYCGKQSRNKSNMTRWHGERCKDKLNDH